MSGHEIDTVKQPSETDGRARLERQRGQPRQEALPRFYECR